MERELRRFLAYPRMDRAYRLADRGQFAAALAEANRALEADPDNPEILRQIFALTLRQGDAKAVEKAADKLLARQPTNGMALTYRGVARLQLDRPAEALADLLTARSQGGLQRTEEDLARDAAADAALRAGQPRVVITLLDGRNTFRDRLRLGMGRAASGDGRGALADLAAAVKLAASGQERGVAFRAWANAAFSLDQRDGLRAAIERELKAAPADTDLLRVRAAVAEKDGDAAAAAAYFAKSVDKAAPASDWERLARLQLAAGHPVDALAAARSGADAAVGGADRVSLDLLIARGQLAGGDAEAASQTYARIAGQLPGTSKLEWATSLEAAGRPREAAEVLDQVARQASGEERAELAARAATLFARAGDLARARGAIGMAEGAVPGSNAYLNMSAELALAAGDYPAAASTLRRMLGSGHDPRLLMRLAELEELQGHASDAINLLRLVVAAEPRGSRERNQALMRIGNLEMAANKPAEAAESFTLAYQEGGRAAQARQAALTAFLAAGAPDRALGLHPDAMGLLAVADSQLGQGQSAAALETLQKAVKGLRRNSPARVGALTRLGHLALQQGQPDLAATSFVTAFREEGRHSQTLMESATVALRRAGRTGEAVALLRSLPRTSPLYIAAQRQLADTLSAEGEYVQAASALDEVVRAQQATAQDLLQLGVLHQQTGHCAEALEPLAQAAEQGAGASARLYQALCLKAQGEEDRTISLLEDLGKQPDGLNPEARKTMFATLGYLLSARGRDAEAADAFRQAQENGGDAHLALARAHSLRLAHRPEEAAAECAAIDLAALHPSEQAVWYEETAELAEARGDHAAAAEAMRQAAERDPSGDRFLRLGRLLASAGHQEEAWDALSRARTLLPQPTDATMELAYLARARGDNEKAVALFTEALSESPKNRAATYQDLGYSLKALGRSDEAAQAFRNALDVLPVSAGGAADRFEIEQAYQLRREVAEAEKNFSATAYLTYQDNGRLGEAPLRQAGTGSQAGAELAYAIPGISDDDRRRLQVYAGVYMDTQSGMPDPDRTQVQAGLRYKPFTDQNLVFFAGRLFGVGDLARDGWLLGTGYSWADKADLDPARPVANYTNLDVAAAGVLGSGSAFYANGEFLQGVSFRVTENSVLVPHAVAVANYADDRDVTNSRIALGPGLRYTFWLGGDDHSAESFSSTLDFQYRFDVAGNAQQGHGPFVRLVMNY